MPTPQPPHLPSEEHVDERFDQIHALIETIGEKAETAAHAAASVRTDLGAKLDDLAGTVSKLASARLLQQGFTSLVLAALITVGIKALGG